MIEDEKIGLSKFLIIDDSHDDRGPLKVLIIDDDSADRKLIKTALNKIPKREFEVCEAECADEIEEKLNSTYDLILLDLVMPLKSGLEWFPEIVEKCKAPVIVVTGQSLEETQFEKNNKDLFGFIPKSSLSDPDLAIIVLNNEINHALECWDIETSIEEAKRRLAGEKAERRLKTIRVLIIDDDPADRKLMIDIVQKIEGKNFVVFEAGDSAEIEKALDELKIDIILLDLIMPGKSGMQWLPEILKRDIAPVVIVTARSDQEARFESAKEGAIGFIQKKWMAEEKIAIVMFDYLIKHAIEEWKVAHFISKHQKELQNERTLNQYYKNSYL